MSESYYEHTQNDSEDDMESLDNQSAANDTLEFVLERLPIWSQATKNSGSKVSNLDMDAKPSSDVNVTARSRSPNKVEQITVVSGNEEIGSSMQRIASNLMQVSDSDR